MPNCDDGVDCTVDGCDESSGGCLNEPADVLCSDGVVCNGTEFCDPLVGCEVGTERGLARLLV